MKNKVLVIDDELSIRESFSLILEDKYQVLLAASGEGALKTIADNKVDLAFLDIRMPGLDGLETLKRLKDLDPELEVIMVTAVNDVQKANQAVKLGARDYLIKPFDVDAVIKIAQNILHRKELEQSGTALLEIASQTQPQLVGQSERLKEILKSIAKVAVTDQRVLITGEAGTEKAVVAELIHRQSPRSQSPFVTFSLTAAMSPEAIKQRLLGGGKGSTTADLQRLSGVVESARGGTLLLDHIDHLPAELVASLPTEVRWIGGSQLTEAADQSKTAREFFAQAAFHLPPLRERTVDFPFIVKYFIDKICHRLGKETVEITGDALAILADYNWPGNTAELAALLEQLLITTSSTRLSADNLPLHLLLSKAGAGSDYFNQFENHYCRRLYTEAGQDKEKTASLLGISTDLLASKL